MSGVFWRVETLNYGTAWRWRVVAYGDQAVASGKARTQAAARHAGGKALAAYKAESERAVRHVRRRSKTA